MSQQSPNNRRSPTPPRAHPAGNLLIALGAVVVAGAAATIAWFAGKGHERSLINEELAREKERNSANSRRRMERAPVTTFTGGDDSGGSLCVVCQDNIANIVFSPCNHLCCCPICAQAVANHPDGFNCPTCRQAVEDVSVVYPQ